MPTGRTRSSAFDVDIECRICGERHRVHGVAEIVKRLIMFGGGAAPGDVGLPWQGPVICPTEQRPFEAELLIPATDGESLGPVRIESVDPAVDSRSPTAVSGAPARDWIDEELEDWRKTSVATARTYATTMLSASTGGVPIYFATLTYLGWAKADLASAWVTLSVLPPVLFLVAAGLFALALRPALTYVDRAEYVEFRTQRIIQMHRRSTAGTLLFGVALIVSIVMFFVVLWESQ